MRYLLLKYKGNYEGLQQHFNLINITVMDNRMTNTTTNKWYDPCQSRNTTMHQLNSWTSLILKSSSLREIMSREWKDKQQTGGNICKIYIYKRIATKIGKEGTQISIKKK